MLLEERHQHCFLFLLGSRTLLLCLDIACKGNQLFVDGRYLVVERCTSGNGKLTGLQRETEGAFLTDTDAAETLRSQDVDGIECRIIARTGEHSFLLLHCCAVEHHSTPDIFEINKFSVKTVVGKRDFQYHLLVLCCLLHGHCYYCHEEDGGKDECSFHIQKFRIYNLLSAPYHR